MMTSPIVKLISIKITFNQIKLMIKIFLTLNYNILKPFCSEQYKYSMKRKYLSKSISDVSITTGSGAYNNCIEINGKGKYPLSKISNVQEVNFGINK